MKKVLVVDDSETVRRQVGDALREASYTVVEAKDGLEALAQLKGHPDTAMVILDVNMPRMGGLDMLQNLHGDAALSHIPVLILTTEADPALIERARSSGAKGWLVKPVKPALLVSAVARFVS